MRQFDLSRRTPEERTADIISGQVITIKNQSRRLDEFEQREKQFNKLITKLITKNDILEYENKSLKTALRTAMSGDKQHA